jgi:hypothetical protein
MAFKSRRKLTSLINALYTSKEKRKTSSFLLSTSPLTKEVLRYNEQCKERDARKTPGQSLGRN